MRRVNVSFVLDFSGSMSSHSKNLTNAVNEMIDQLRSESKNTYVSVTVFGNEIKVIQPKTKITNVGKFDKFNCNMGMTALFDGIAHGVDYIGGEKHSNDENYLVLVFTDGCENASKIYSATDIKRLIKHHESLDNWTFTIQLPKGYKQQFAQQFGIPEGNLAEWNTQSEDGVIELKNIVSNSISNYYSATRSGSRSVKNFYSFTTDMTSVAPKDLKKNLMDMQHSFKVLKVDKECDIKPFVERKAKLEYRKGIAYYQLSKDEIIQADKDVLIMEKGKAAIYGGNDARAMIGLPVDGVTKSKVKPGNHSKYDIFVQSNSVNRKLVRGTNVLVKV